MVVKWYNSFVKKDNKQYSIYLFNHLVVSFPPIPNHELSMSIF